MAFVLSKRTCLVKLVKASTLTMISVVPIEGTNTAASHTIGIRIMSILQEDRAGLLEVGIG